MLGPWYWGAMTSWRRWFALSFALAAPLFGVLAACGSTPTDQVGKPGQPCFPGDTCDPGLTCIAESISTDGASLGTDGGQCWDLSETSVEDLAASEAGDADVVEED